MAARKASAQKMVEAPRTWENPRLAHVGGFNALHEELDYLVPNGDVIGKLPKELRGTFFRIGPGRNEIGGQKFGHWFDGDGMLHSMSFTAQGLRYRNRYVRTPKYIAETQAQKIVYRSFGHNAPGGIRKNAFKLPENCANTSLVWHGGHLLALWEGGRPYKLNPHTLETVGEFNYGGRLQPWNAFSAHGKVDPRTGYYYNFGVGVGLKGPGIDFYRIDPRGCLDRKAYFPIKGAPFCHDFAITEHYAVFFVSPLRIANPLKVVAGVSSISDELTYFPEDNVQGLVISLDTMEVVRRFECPSFVAIHYGNCWEEGNELVINLTRFEDWQVGENLKDLWAEPNESGGRYWEYRLNLGTGELSDRALPGHHSIEFPQWDHRRTGLKTRFSYMAAILDTETNGFFNGLERLDHETGDVIYHDYGAGRFNSEAMYTPRTPDAEEGDGFVMSVVFNAHTDTSSVFVHKAETLEVLAEVPLRHHVPFGFHGGYTSKSFA